MPKTRTLLLGLAVGCVAFVLLAFTIVGLVGEALVLVCTIGLSARAVASVAHRSRRGGHI